ncbi:hypothetical protein Bca4012_097579 [Brassica carinata]|uniref:Uncharacterized protein n=1 Tax=Brassica carinata TaxID=52824 RepID=A0A8X7PGF5_BRACI|nr:hypothetical protein Bca52824_080339 [Brassica carinata]
MTLRESVEGLEIVVGDVYAMEIEASGSCALLSSSPSVEKVEEEAQRSSELKVQFGATETHLRGRYKYFSELEASGPALLAPLKNSQDSLSAS